MAQITVAAVTQYQSFPSCVNNSNTYNSKDQ